MKLKRPITYFEALLERLGNGHSDNAVCATALAALLRTGREARVLPLYQ